MLLQRFNHNKPQLGKWKEGGGELLMPARLHHENNRFWIGGQDSGFNDHQALLSRMPQEDLSLEFALQ